MSHPKRKSRTGRPKPRRADHIHYFRSAKSAPGNESGFTRDIAQNPEVVEEIISYARKVAPDLSIIPESNLFPVLCQVIIRSVKTGYEIACRHRK